MEPTMDTEGRTCLLCFDHETDPVLDPFLEPCTCSGSMAFIHESCLFESRVQSFDPKTLTTCSLCRTAYRTVDAQGGGGSGSSPLRELFLAVCKYLGLRLSIFSFTVVALGFVPRLVTDWLGEQPLPMFFQSTVLNHLSQGLFSTLMCAGSWFMLQLYLSLGIWARILHNPWVRQRKSGSKDAGSFIVILCAIGLGYLLYHLFWGIFDLIMNAHSVAGANIRHLNRSVREEIARRHRVINLRDTPSKPDIVNFPEVG